MNIRVSALAFLMAVVAVEPIQSQTKREATIEVGTKAQLVLQSRLSSKLNEVGDPVIATLSEPIYAAGFLVMPRDAEFHGHVTSVKPASRIQKSSQMTILFDKVLTPWGEEPVDVLLTAIDDWDKNEKLKANSEGKVGGGHPGDKTVDNVVRGGQIGGMGTGAVTVVRDSPRVNTRTIGGGGAASAGGMISGLLLTKGGEVRVEPGAMLRIEFVKALTLPAQPDPRRIP